MGAKIPSSPAKLLDSIIEHSASELELMCLSSVTRATTVVDQTAYPLAYFSHEFFSAFRIYAATNALRNRFGQVVGLRHVYSGYQMGLRGEYSFNFIENLKTRIKLRVQ